MFLVGFVSSVKTVGPFGIRRSGSSVIFTFSTVLCFCSSLYSTVYFKPPPPVGAGGGYMFSGRPSVPPSVRACVRPSVSDSRGSFMFPQYLQYLLTDFRQTFSLVHLGTQMT